MIGHERFGRRCEWSRLLIVTGAWLMALMVAACGDPFTQPASPLPPGIDPRLVTGQWTVVKAVHQGQELELDGVPRFRVGFHWGGSVYFTSYCHAGAFRIDFRNENQYRMVQSPTAGITCTTPLDREQLRALYTALEATREYSFQSGWLWLTGEETQIALEVAETFPFFPTAEPRLMLNRWRWIDVQDRDGSVSLESLSPIFTTFWQDEIRVEIGDCMLLHKLNTGIMDEYFLQPVWDHGRCRANLAAEGVRALDTLLMTRAHEFRGDQLFLIGETDNVRVVMEVDGPYPPN